MDDVSAPVRTPVMLSIAGSDPSGGAGVQADVKTATALGVYAGAVLTALTAQNTRGVQGIHAVPAAFVAEQLESVLSDLDVQAVKIGMLGTPDVAAAVAEALRRRPVPHVVLDPVMVASSGDRLVPEETTEVIAHELLPLATVVTPNVPEAEVLTGLTVRDVADMERAAARLLRTGAAAALVKGGHLEDPDAVDVLVGPGGTRRFAAPRVRTEHTHGTGCTLSSAVAAFLVAALASGSRRHVGAGRGPVDHLGGR